MGVGWFGGGEKVTHRILTGLCDEEYVIHNTYSWSDHVGDSDIIISNIILILTMV